MKLLRNISILLFGFALLMGASACEKVLDEKPFSQLADEQFWKNNADAASGVVSIYDAMQKTYNSKLYVWGEMRSDNFTPTTSSTATSLELMKNSLQASNDGVLRWNSLFLMISRANLAIEKIPTIPAYDRSLLGEAHMARAYAYFDAVRVWGGVPLFTEPIKGLDQELQRPKTDGAKIINDVIIPDMLEGEKLIAPTKDQFRFSKSSVYAFQAQVYMHLKQFDKAKVALDKLVALKAFSLVTTRDAWSKLFLNDVARGGKFQVGTELIFSLRFSLTEDSDRSGIYAIFFAGLPNYNISALLENKWIAKFPTDSIKWKLKYPTTPPKAKNVDGSLFYGDWRYAESREGTLLLPAIGSARLAKYNKINYSPSIDDSDMHLFRYAGVLLMLAEAENQLGNTAAALALVNQIRDARELPRVLATEFTNKAELENIILDERQMELLGEGVRWWDLIRTGKAVEVMGPINGQKADKLLFPILQRHLNDNPLLTQTPGY
jgi:starch-binding outer membrane protein, SusD/RagB family